VNGVGPAFGAGGCGKFAQPVEEQGCLIRFGGALVVLHRLPLRSIVLAMRWVSVNAFGTKLRWYQVLQRRYRSHSAVRVARLPGSTDIICTGMDMFVMLKRITVQPSLATGYHDGIGFDFCASTKPHFHPGRWDTFFPANPTESAKWMPSSMASSTLSPAESCDANNQRRAVSRVLLVGVMGK